MYFYFPIDPKWGDKDLCLYFYEKIKKYPEIYKFENYIRSLKKIESLKNFVPTHVGNNLTDYPLVFWLSVLIYQRYNKIKFDPTLQPNEILLFCYIMHEDWPTSNAVYFDYPIDKINPAGRNNIDYYLNLIT